MLYIDIEYYTIAYKYFQSVPNPVILIHYIIYYHLVTYIQKMLNNIFFHLYRNITCYKKKNYENITVN